MLGSNANPGLFYNSYSPPDTSVNRSRCISPCDILEYDESGMTSKGLHKIRERNSEQLERSDARPSKGGERNRGPQKRCGPHWGRLESLEEGVSDRQQLEGIANLRNARMTVDGER